VVTCILVGVVLMGLFRVFIFGCSAYIRRLLFVFSISPVFICLEQGSGCLIKSVVSKTKAYPNHRHLKKHTKIIWFMRFLHSR